MLFKDFLIQNNVPFENGKIKIPDWCRRVKLDIGLSGNAPQSKVWLDKEDDLFIFGFEPVPENIEMIKNQGSSYPIKLDPKLIGKRICIIPCALGNVEQGSLTKFYVTSNDTGCSSMYKPNWFPVKYETEVPLWSLKHFFDLFPWERFPYIDFIKTDCQGADLDVLKGSKEYIEKIAIITSEPEQNQYANTRNGVYDISTYLKSKDFVKVNVSTTIDPTYINKKLVSEIKKNNITCNQE